ncbi:hypothetical protein [Bacillus timonensis]|uniref:hypothetical protein n=1 Tax=Bacillus timonensis TaxID=1033734 RepID=UPI0002898F87|nr:hypothetical protein [Bacillus timonensis]
MLKIIITIISTIIVGVGGYMGYHEFVKTDKEKVEEVSTEVKGKNAVNDFVLLKKEDVQKILDKRIDPLFETLLSSGERNGWGPGNPVDYNVLKPEVMTFVTNSFADTTLQEFVEEFYCGCDSVYLPKIHYDVRFDFEQKEENNLKVFTLEPANELHNIGTLSTFNLSKENDEWKIDGWNFETLDGKDIQLTKEEAEKILSQYEGTPEFIKEYESKEAQGKAYLFNLKSSNGEYLVAISSKDTRLVYDFALEKKEDSEVKNNTETIEVTNLYEEFYEKMNFGKTKEELIAQYGQPISENELSGDFTVEYIDATYTISKVSNQIYKVEILGDKASIYYDNFDEVVKAYNPDPVYAEYFDERSMDENGYHIKFDDGYSKSHIFTSKNQNGNPISSITIQLLEFR